MTIKAYPKINLGLDILRKRDDGFHDIDTLMLPIKAVADTLTIEPNTTGGCSLHIEGLQVDCSAERNLVVRAWMLLKELYDVGGVDMQLHKAIPFGAGLGGGSADAAAALTGIAKLYELPISEAELIQLASRLGSDVPFFIRSEPTFCRGRGEIMEPAEMDLSGLWCVVSKPAFGISTAEAYAGVTPSIPATPLCERLRLPLQRWQSEIVNDFERSLFPRHTALPNIKRELQRCGALYASMSGSGSAMFGLFDHEPTYAPIFAGEEVFVCKL
ncbi:MAG: 4-(cytidine 5'-diphospho)-2-C-methyl-D-erythritol kinase [Tidjanibacter sp.]|nr:4-(cytidine 5'-diphospho)-2-C-methyl-D-erythritol kinase [Tidjanibacter sp.]